MRLKRGSLLSMVCVVALTADGATGLRVMAQDEIRKKEPAVVTKEIVIERSPDGNMNGFNFLWSSQAAAGFLTAEMSFDDNIVKGAPFSAEAVTEFIQVLGDGNRIVRRTAANICRDSEGRTRRDETFSSLNALATGNAQQREMSVISIFDPVSGVRHRIDPNTHTVHKIPIPVPLAPSSAPTGTAPKQIKVTGGVLQGSAVKKVQPSYPPIAKAARAQGAVQVQVTINENGEVIEASAINGHPLLRDAALDAARQWQFKPTELAGVPVKVQGILTFNFTLADPDKKDELGAGAMPGKPVAVPSALPGSVFKQEPLGKQTFDGVEAVGTRTVQTIPAGAIGNERPIESITERWYSQELQTVIMTKHSDPRVGETIYRLTNINRSEPDASLFQPPAGYTIQEVDLQKKIEFKLAKPKDQ